MKKLAIVAVILLILGALVAFALMNLGSLVNRNKDYILAQAEQALGRKVEVGDIGVTLWGGIGVRLKEFSVADDKGFSSQDFIRADDLQVNVEFLPLLQKEVRVKRLILNKPMITVVRNKRGGFNFASLGGPGQVEKEQKKAAPAATTEALPLLVSLVDVADGEVRYLDKKEGVDVRVSHVDLTVEDVGLERPISIDFAAAVLADEQNIRIEGQVGPVGSKPDFRAVPVKGDISITEFNIDTLQRAFPQVKQYLPKGLGLSGPVQAKMAVSGSAASLTLSKVDLRAAVFGANKPNFQLTGRLGPVGKNLKKLSMNSDITLGPVALASLQRFAPLAGALPQDLRADGPLTLKAHVEGTPENLALKGNVAATESALSLGNSFRKPRGVPFLLIADARVTKKKITLKKTKMKLHTLELSGSGTITRAKTPAMRLALSSSRTDLTGWDKILPQLQGYDLSGGMEVDTRIRGEIRKGRTPQINGSMTLSEFRATLPQVPGPLSVPKATVTFTGQRATLPDTPLRIGNSQMRLAAQVEKFTPLTLTYRLSAPELRLADLRKVNEATKRPEVLRQAKSDGRVSVKNGLLSYKGKLSSARGTIADMDYTNLNAFASVAGQVAKIDGLGFRAYKGSFKGRGRYEYGQTSPRFKFTSQVRGMQLAEFIRSSLPAAPKHLRGALNLDLNLAGSGTQWEDIQRTLTGQGKADVTKGALVDVNIAEGALTGTTGVPGLTLFISPRVRKKYPAIFATRDTEFDQLKGSMTIKNGKVNLDDLVAAAADWAVYGRGWVGLDRTLDVRAVLVLSQQFSRDLISDVNTLKFLTNRRGSVEIPFVLAGTFPGAKPQPDLEHVAALVQRGLLGELTKGVFKGSSPPPQQAPKQEQEPAKPAPTEKPRKATPEEEILKGLEKLFRR